MTGCLPTADRLYQAGMVTTPKCRWCGECDETIQHLTAECAKIQELLGVPAKFFHDQPHFLSHGIWEVPQFLLDAAKNASTKIPLPSIEPSVRASTFFVEGSATNSDHFFSKTLGFAAGQEDGQILFAHGFVDPFGSQFKAALLSLWNLVRSYNGQCEVYTSCKALVRVWDRLSHQNTIPINFAFHDIWDHLFSLVRFGDFCRMRLLYLPVRAVSLLANNVKNVMDAATTAARQACPISCQVLRSWRSHVNIQRAWLCKLSKLVQEAKYENGVPQEEPLEVCPDQQCTQNQSWRNRFVRWDWDLPRDVFQWSPQGVQLHKPPKWQFSDCWWNDTLNFFFNLQWRCGEATTCCTSVFELAFVFWVRLKRVPPATGDTPTGTFLIMVNWLRQFFRTVRHDAILPPDARFRAKQKSWLSQTYPKGTIQGGRIFLTSSEMHLFAKFVASLPNNGRTAADWAISLESLP